MHEGKGELKMDIQASPLQRSLNGTDVGNRKTVEIPSGLLMTNGKIRRNSDAGDHGSAEEDNSSGDEALTIQIPPKKNRLKEPSNHNIILSTLAASIKARSSPTPTTPSSNGNGMRKDPIDENEDNQDDGEESLRFSAKESGVSTSFTSGENSDSEIGQDGEEFNGSDMKHEDSRKLFECDVCNMKFSNGANMRRHRMRHSGIKPYECKICKKRFFRKDHLAEHMTTHSKLLPFRCPICNKGFQRQIAMRAHFQNEHVGGSQEMVKACPLCSYKAGSMKSLRIHFYSRHGIDLDNPMPHSPIHNGGGSSSPGLNGNGEYSELAHALGFEDREKSSDSIIPSHFLVPQIEISSNSTFLSHFPFTADSRYNFAQEERNNTSNNSNGTSSSPNVSPQSDRSSIAAPSSSEMGSAIIKKEVIDEQHNSIDQHAHSSEDNDEPSDLSNKACEIPDDTQDSPEDLSSGNSSTYRRSSHSPKTSSFSIIKISPLKSLLREDINAKDKSQCTIAGTNQNNANHCNSSTNNSNTSLNGNRGSTSNTNNNSVSGSANNNNALFQSQSYDGESANSNGVEENTSASHSINSRTSNRRGSSFPNAIHQCLYCGIIFPDKTLYFLHKGCHSDSNPWRCNICGEFCYNVYDFNSHLLSKSHQ